MAVETMTCPGGEVLTVFTGEDALARMVENLEECAARGNPVAMAALEALGVCNGNGGNEGC